MRRESIRAALARERPLVTPLAHDALSARLIERAGFNAFAIGGSAMLAARYALPDIGLIGLSDMIAGIRDIASASMLPFLADGDDGYGDAKNVVRMVAAYEAAGAGGVLIEDQLRERKQQRDEPAKAVVDEAEILGKLRVALAARSDPEMLIIGRTDAYGALGLDAALRRAERFLDVGVDGVFVAGLRGTKEYERVGRTLNRAILSAAIFGGGDMPWLTPADLGEMGFSHVAFPGVVISRAVDAMSAALADLRAHADNRKVMQPPSNGDAARRTIDSATDLEKWSKAADGEHRNQQIEKGEVA